MLTQHNLHTSTVLPVLWIRILLFRSFRIRILPDRIRTRQAAGPGIQYARTDPRKYSFAVRAVEKWNNLPEDVKASQNGEVFKKKLKKM
jgi:hypothetical protein